MSTLWRWREEEQQSKVIFCNIVSSRPARARPYDLDSERKIGGSKKNVKASTSHLNRESLRVENMDLEPTCLGLHLSSAMYSKVMTLGFSWLSTTQSSFW